VLSTCAAIFWKREETRKALADEQGPFCVAALLCELESVDCAIAMPHDSSAIETTQMKVFMLILSTASVVVNWRRPRCQSLAQAELE
jgi:hypothetical protein